MKKIYNYGKEYFHSLAPDYYQHLDKHKTVVKYLISGGTAAGVDLCLLYILTDIFQIHYLLSASLAFIVAFFVSFYLQKFWTFRDNCRKKIYKQMSLYFVVGITNLGINIGGMYVLVDKFNVMYILAQMIMGACIAIGSFLIYRYVIFKKHKKELLASKAGKLKILIATGIFPPDIGGPATYASSLRDELPKFGCEIKVVTYGNQRPKDNIFSISRKQNIIFRYFKYFRQIWKLANWADVIYAFDIISVGLPCAIVKLLKPKTKLVARLGGDHQWEMAMQKGRYKNTLEQYYADKKFNLVEKLIYYINNFVLFKTDKIIFNAYILRDIFIKHRNIGKKKTAVIKNVAPARINIEFKKQFKDYINILFIGRLVAFKNLLSLIESFTNIKQGAWPKKIILEIIGEGPEKQKLINYVNKKELGQKVKILPKLNHREALNKIYNSDIISAVSFTEVNAHVVSEATVFNKPIILTKKSESHYVGEHNNKIFYVDPLDLNDMTKKMELILGKMFNSDTASDDSDYAAHGRQENKISWDINKVIKTHLEIFNNLLKKHEKDS